MNASIATLSVLSGVFLSLQASAAPLLNGGFESGLSGWTATGNISILAGPPYAPTQGSKLIAFNAGNSAPNGVLSQTVDNLGGRWHKLLFDVGNLSYNTQAQKLGVKVTEITDAVYTPLSEEITIPGISGGKTRWVSKEYIFTPRTHPLTLTFQDLSQTTNSLDLVLDNVRLVPSCNLLISSSIDYPGPGIEFVISPASFVGSPGTHTQTAPWYFAGTGINLTAPVHAGGMTFKEWRKDGLIYSTDPHITFTIEVDTHVVAIYQPSIPTLTPAENFETRGPAGTGPFTPSGKTYVLTNLSSLPSEWSASTQVTPPWSTDPNWLSVSPQNGFLNPGQSVEIRLGTSAAAKALAPGTHGALLKISTPFGNLIQQSTITITAQPVYSPLASGGFESGFSGWEATGNVSLRSSSPYTPTEGSTLAVFNAMDSVPNGSLRQTVAVVPGYHYRMDFDVGVLSSIRTLQELRVAVTNTWTDATYPVFVPQGGPTTWTSAYCDFVPSTSHVTVVFSDVSDNTLSADLLLDNIRITRIPPPPLENSSFEAGLEPWTHSGNVTVKSQPPYLASDGAKLAVFNSENSAPNGQLILGASVINGHPYRLTFDVGNLSYQSQAQRMRFEIFDYLHEELLVSEIINIPGTTGGATSWLEKSYPFIPKGGFVQLFFTDVSQATNSVDLVLDNVKIKEDPPVTLLGGGFENGLANWDTSGHVIVGASPSYAPAQGSKLIAFNSGNSTPDGVVSQTVATVPGQTYRLDFKAGNLAFNRQSQRLHVQVSSRFNGILQTPVLQVIEIAAPQNSGSTRWIPASYEFIPQGDAATITFSDVSTGTVSSDLLLDDVKISP